MDSASGGSIEERVDAILEALEKGGLFLIVQDLYPIETARYAHIVLPAAQWGEMNLTSISRERRLRLYQKFMDPPGVAEPDWKIMAMMAQKLQMLYQAEGNVEKAARFSGFEWQTEEEVFRAAAEGVKGAQEDYGETTYAMLTRLGTNGVQTPVKEMKTGLPVGTMRLYEDAMQQAILGKAEGQAIAELKKRTTELEQANAELTAKMPRATGPQPSSKSPTPEPALPKIREQHSQDQLQEAVKRLEECMADLEKELREIVPNKR